MLLRKLLDFLNHLLVRDPLCQDRLAAFAGQSVRIRIGAAPAAFSQDVHIDAEGLLRPARVAENAMALGDMGVSDTSAPDVCIELPVSAPLLWLSNRQALLTAARISGSVELAESLSFVFKNLDWDVEDDLAHLFSGSFAPDSGTKPYADVLARRLTQLGQNFFGFQQQLAENLLANFGEYFADESRQLLRQESMQPFLHRVDELRDRLARLEKRVQCLG